jgi:hypothetical protein
MRRYGSNGEKIMFSTHVIQAILPKGFSIAQLPQKRLTYQLRHACGETQDIGIRHDTCYADFAAACRIAVNNISFDRNLP